MTTNTNARRKIDTTKKGVSRGSEWNLDLESPRRELSKSGLAFHVGPHTCDFRVNSCGAPRRGHQSAHGYGQAGTSVLQKHYREPRNGFRFGGNVCLFWAGYACWECIAPGWIGVPQGMPGVPRRTRRIILANTSGMYRVVRNSSGHETNLQNPDGVRTQFHAWHS
jgi:hypothetical protein